MLLLVSSKIQQFEQVNKTIRAKWEWTIESNWKIQDINIIAVENKNQMSDYPVKVTRQRFKTATIKKIHHSQNWYSRWHMDFHCFSLQNALLLNAHVIFKRLLSPFSLLSFSNNSIWYPFSLCVDWCSALFDVIQKNALPRMTIACIVCGVNINNEESRRTTNTKWGYIKSVDPHGNSLLI